MSTFLKNIYFFTKILQQASTEEVATWNKDSLQNALHWAAYCKEIYKQVIKKPYKEVFDQQLIKLNAVQSSPLICGDLNLQFLDKATDNLRQLLFCNCHLPEELFEELIQISLGEKEIIIKQCAELSSLHASLQIISRLERDIVNCSYDKCRPSKTGTRLSLVTIVKTEILWQRLINQISIISDEDRLDLLVLKIISNLPASKDGWEILLYLLTKKDVDINPTLWNISKDSYSKVYQFLEQFVQNNITMSKPPSIIWSVAEDLFSQVILLSFPVFSTCLRQLIDWAKQFSPVYHHHDQRNSLYTWQLQEKDSNEISTFADLSKHFMILTNCGEQPKKAVQAALESLQNQTSCSIWHDLLTKISTKDHI
ncbi:uncharacterized protein LOC115214310 isoform X1 [Octopus sinensis]|uniref:Uncharacterized protein LOC115214310 isoform X1 n=1 Tax=Octopus sinensis TaxID=2607531 RepID=A0A6P7SLQ6_9MOLL|nr:uncharacterized protein LOC115214310 isoform X1 [Octopus sinensis]